MSIKEQVLKIVDKSREVELEFLNRLSDEQREEKGEFESWSAKDVVAHVNYWPTVRTEQIKSWLDGDAAGPIPQFDQANLEAFNMFAKQSWAEIEDYARKAHQRLKMLVEAMQEEQFLGPSWRSEEVQMWEPLVQVGYTHKLLHLSEFYESKGQIEDSAHLWSEWADLVSPLDSSDRWQGRVRYNAACGLALAGDHQGALLELRQSLEKNPGMRAWARLDSDLAALHEMDDFKALIARDYWWEALKAGEQAEAVADQFLRTFTMFREVVSAFEPEQWLEGETNYQRPAGIALHIAQTAAQYSALKPGDALDHPTMQINWESPDADLFPDQDEFILFLDVVEEKLAVFIQASDLSSPEDQFRWTGSTKLSRALYTLRHSQHHLADMAMELERRGQRPPDWR